MLATFLMILLTDAMVIYLSALPALPLLHKIMLETPGHCSWWKCHSAQQVPLYSMSSITYSVPACATQPGVQFACDCYVIAM